VATPHIEKAVFRLKLARNARRLRANQLIEAVGRISMKSNPLKFRFGFVTALISAFAAPIALKAQQSSTRSPWYLSLSGGYASGWKGTEDFVFPAVTTGSSSTSPPPTVQRVTTHSKATASLVLGYSAGASGLQAELEGIYLPQEFDILTVSAPVLIPGASPLRQTTTDDFAYLANFGWAGTNMVVTPSFFIGLGRNTSSKADSSTVWQFKAGLAWVINERTALTIDAKYLRASGYTASGSSFGSPAFSQYDFGDVHSISGAVGLRWRF